MVRLRNDQKNTTPWDGRELDEMDEVAWERFKNLRRDIQRRMRPLEAEFIQRWLAEEEEIAIQAGEAIDPSTPKFKENQLVPLILTLIQEREMHGFQIAQAVNQLAKGQYDLRPEVLHPLLHVLEEARVIEGEERKAPDGTRRTYFRLTPWGKKILGQERSVLNAFITALLRTQ
jgi:PadR family transcriptional regulator PadR